MAFNGSGTFNRIYNWVTDLGNNINITASRMDAEQDGIATGLSNCITKDGQTTISANIPFNSKKITGLANGSARTDSISLGQVQDGTYTTLGTTGGSADAYTASPSPAITAYATGSRFIVKISADNTGASTIDISAVGAKDIKKYDGAGAKVDPEAGDLQQDQYYDILYDGTDIVVLNPEKPYINLINAGATTSVLGSTYIPNQITISNGTDADHDIDFTAGNFTFSGGDGQAVASALTKQIDATWAAGTAAGGLADALTVANDTTYHCFVLSSADGTTVDFGFDTSLTATNLLADTAVIAAELTKYKKVASLVTDGSANFVEFRQTGNYFYFLNKDTHDYKGANPGTAKVTVSLPIPSVAGIIADVQFTNFFSGNTGGTRFGVIRGSLEADVAPSNTIFDTIVGNEGESSMVQKQIPTDDSDVWYRISTSYATVEIAVNSVGYYDTTI